MRRTIQTIGFIFGVISLGLLATVLFTNHWVQITILREGISNVPSDELAYFSRNRGLFRECWSDSSLETLIDSNDYFDGGMCLKLDMRMLDIRPVADYTQPYSARAGLMVACMVVLPVAGLMIVIAMFVYFYSLCTSLNTYQWKYSCKTAAVLMFGAAVISSLGIAFFHGAEHMELKIVTDPDGYQAPYKLFFGLDQPEQLITNTKRIYNWSYGLAWLAVAFEILSAILFTIVGFCYVKKTSKKKMTYNQPTSNIGTMSRNPAYEHAEGSVIVAPPQVYIINDDYYQSGSRSYYDPYRKGQPKQSYSPRFSFERGWQLQY